MGDSAFAVGGGSDRHSRKATMILRQTLRWTFYALIALQPLSAVAWITVMKGSATSARFVVINQSTQPLTFTPIGRRGLRLFTRIAGFPALQTGSFRIEPGQSKSISYYCTGGGLGQLYIRTDAGQELQYSKELITDECGTATKEFVIGSVKSLPAAEPNLLEVAGLEPPSGVHYDLLWFYAALSLPFLLIASYLAHQRENQA